MKVGGGSDGQLSSGPQELKGSGRDMKVGGGSDGQVSDLAPPPPRAAPHTCEV